MQSGIQKAQHQQSSFIYGGVRYNLQAASWKQMKFKSNYEFQQQFLGLEEHQYVVMKKSIYTFSPSSANSTLGALYSFNFVNEQIKEWACVGESYAPKMRNKYALIKNNNRLCIFGGVRDKQYFNDLVSFCFYSNEWSSNISANNDVLPSPRIPYIFTEIDNGNMLLFGGYNQSGFIPDAFLLVNSVWKQLKILNKESMEQKFGYFLSVTRPNGIRHCSAMDGVYFFGGVFDSTFTNDFYLMKVDQQSLTLKIQKIATDSGSKPCPRAGHSMQKLGDNCILIYGGFNQSANLRDLSVFNINKKTWSEVYPLNGPLMTITLPRTCSFMNSVVIMGQTPEKGFLRKVVLELKFPEFQIIKSEICSNCIKRLQTKQKDESSAPKKPFVSNGLIYNMAAQMSFPFQAVGLLLDCAETLKATQISIKSDETNNKLTYFDIRFNGKNLTREQYSSIISHSYLQDPIVMEIIDKIKLGSMRLGKTLIFIEVADEFRRVFLFSADSLIISHYHELYAYYSYEEKISDEWLATQESIMHKKFIMNLLHSYFINPEILINSVKNHCFLIFETNVIMTNEKIYYGELITSQADIIQCKNNKKVQFLDQIGFKLSEEPEVSLAKYLQYLYLNSSIKQVQVQNTKIKIAPNKYLLELEKLQTLNKVRALCKERLTIKTIEAECYLYEVIDPAVYHKQIKGVYIYYNGRLINRLDINFGDMFWQKFFKTKYKRAFGLWNHAGVINILKGIQPKSLRNQFKNESYYSYFIREIKKQRLSKHYTTHNSDSIIDVEQEVRVTKTSRRQRN